ncbi:MAG: hypothetical protein WA793_03690 [Sphingorhabdus sp.]|uniref:hypothetical protein n=1 Tax=Sphingorhabdus sp. TaxID=1902408 RepID=UPI003C82A597
MQTETDNFDKIVERFRQMPSGDRKAVLSRLGLEQRLTLEQTLSGRLAQVDVEQSPPPSHWNRLFSPVLARMLTDIDRDEPTKGGNGKPLTAATRAALADCAKTYAEDQLKAKAGQPSSLLETLSKLVFPARGK